MKHIFPSIRRFSVLAAGGMAWFVRQARFGLLFPCPMPISHENPSQIKITGTTEAPQSYIMLYQASDALSGAGSLASGDVWIALTACPIAAQTSHRLRYRISAFKFRLQSFI